MRLIPGLALCLIAALLPATVRAGAQQYEPLAASVQASLHAAIADRASPEPHFSSIEDKVNWMTEMSGRLTRRIPDREARLDFLKTVHYEAKRAGLDVGSAPVFDTFTVKTGPRTEEILARAESKKINLRRFDEQTLGVALDETVGDHCVSTVNVPSVFTVRSLKRQPKNESTLSQLIAPPAMAPPPLGPDSLALI